MPFHGVLLLGGATPCCHPTYHPHHCRAPDPQNQIPFQIQILRFGFSYHHQGQHQLKAQGARFTFHVRANSGEHITPSGSTSLSTSMSWESSIRCDSSRTSWLSSSFAGSPSTLYPCKEGRLDAWAYVRLYMSVGRVSDQSPPKSYVRCETIFGSRYFFPNTICFFFFFLFLFFLFFGLWGWNLCIWVWLVWAHEIFKCLEIFLSALSCRVPPKTAAGKLKKFIMKFICA